MATVTKDTLIGDILDMDRDTHLTFWKWECIVWDAHPLAVNLWKKPAWCMAWM